MAELYHKDETPQRVYWDRRYYMTFDDQLESLKGATTLYVGNLSFYTTEVQIHETFSRAGPVKRIIMGLNRETKAPCGFCFVEFYTYENACAALKYLDSTVCDGQTIRCELDGGFKPGRQFGRGKSGGQIRDERKQQELALRLGAPKPPYPPGNSRGRAVVLVPPDIDRHRGDEGGPGHKGGKDLRPIEDRLENGLSTSRGQKRSRSEDNEEADVDSKAAEAGVEPEKDPSEETRVLRRREKVDKDEDDEEVSAL